ncbi:uncharacterized protein M421DRAFT_278083 [Didymella exigua CBS 183.55]|uniref:Linalool dehydratase/isomerase domain-containing protein n=1 Tax=Didymella exigua CBS 183.55 TaxID=1150837 RepID=A0A6A5RC15_9PLEO|nr:uncharacterized protein M421DRAFT_278083 [Didymella exigua CBS 183.55]KAF1924614.1 hypothetical protein M421DRAFT_278083 [Didymella exigua CBS 183.55]
MLTSVLLAAGLAAQAVATAIDSRKTVLTAEAQTLFDYSMFVQDNRYDASYNYIAYGDKGSWSVRFTAWYLAGLLHRNEGDDLEHAKAAIMNIISVQMTDDFDAAWYGTYKLSPDQPDPTPNSTLYPPKIYETYDPNWREFIGTQFVQVVEEFGHLIGADLVARIEESLEIAAVGGMRRNGTFPENDNLTLGYSNPGMMRALVVGWIGARRNNSEFIAFANEQGTKLLELFQLNGANTLSEYNAPTYYGIDSWALGAQLKYGPRDQTFTTNAKTILAELWHDLEEHYNGYLGQMVGPYDRAYTRDIVQHSSIVSMFFWGMFGHSHGPQPPKLDGDLLFDIAQGAAIALVIDTVKSIIPSDVQEKLRGTFTGPDRHLNKTIYDELGGAHPRIATSWMSRELMIGGQQLAEQKNRGDQFVPAIVHWAGDKSRTPFPLSTFFSLYPSASSIHAVAEPNRLTVSYPNTTQEGSDIFTFALSNVPPSWTLGGHAVTGLDGELPCVDIKVDASGLEAQPVTYGKALRNHLFYNISYVVPGDFEGTPRVVLDINYTC